MKEIVLQATPVLVPANANPNLYYGIAKRSDIPDGFILQPLYREGRYQAMALDGFTYGNQWSNYADITLAGVITRCLKGELRVHQFDSPEELFAWLATREES